MSLAGSSPCWSNALGEAQDGRHNRRRSDASGNNFSMNGYFRKVVTLGWVTLKASILNLIYTGHVFNLAIYSI